MTLMRTGEIHGTLPRALRFLQKPWREKSRSFYFRWIRVFPNTPLPVRLPFGAWWLANNDYLGATLFYEGFEEAERSFVESFLRPGMTVLDIGAHHGYYTLLASRRVGSRGRVVAFEPSPRERSRLNLHLRLNRCKNVSVESCALGDADSEEELFLASRAESGLNSLRRPDVSGATTRVSVAVQRLDDVLLKQRIGSVDFVKLDVEGAELSVLKGARELLTKRPRPVILAEVQDVRTTPWGYEAKEIVRFLSDLDYRWYAPAAGGRLGEMDVRLEKYDGNFVAVPEEHGAALR
jgi:FkbM family methyltransferase